MRRRKEPKARTQQRHASKRAEERFGIAIGKHTMEDLVNQIQSGRARFLERQSRRVTVFEVDLQGSPAAAVYDAQRKTIVTLMPMEWHEGEGLRWWDN